MDLPVAIVTGGTRGIGYGIAAQLLKNDIFVIICSRSKTRPSNLHFPVKNENSLFLSCDIALQQERTALIRSIIDKYGRIDILVNNAGIAPPDRKDILSATEKSFERVLQVNLQGPFFLTQQVANHMIETHASSRLTWANGVIINISSISAYTSSVNRGEYCISKAGMSMMTKLYADRLAEYQIPVFEIQPGIIKTSMTAPVEEKYTKKIQEGLLPIRRWGLPEDVGKTVLGIVTGQIPYSTGEILHIDGGFHIRRL